MISAAFYNTGLGFVVLNDTYNISVGGSSNVSFDSFEEFLCRKTRSKSVARCNGGNYWVLFCGIKRLNVFCPDTAVKLNDGDFLSECVFEAVNESFAYRSENETCGIVVKSGTYHFHLRRKVFCGLTCGALESNFVTVLFACVYGAGFNRLPECVGFAFCNNGNGLVNGCFSVTFGRVACVAAAACEESNSQRQYAKKR